MASTQHQFPSPFTYPFRYTATGQTETRYPYTVSVRGTTTTRYSFQLQTLVPTESQLTGNTRGSTQNLSQVIAQGSTSAQNDVRYPFTIQHTGNTRNPQRNNVPAIGTTEVVGNTRLTVRYPFTYTFQYSIQNTMTGNTQIPNTYPYRSPSIGINPNITTTYPYIANNQNTVPYIFQYPFTYPYRSPSIVQNTTSGTRPVSQVAEAKAVYVKTSQGVEKISDIYVKKDSQTVSKIHQAVPSARLNRQQSDTQY